MSDFDKEAEREKLRKKYERDKADREATKRMSDLLLKGARMTNTHCDTCGDPLFEQNDVTFCPTCHGGPDGVEASLDEAEEDDEDGAAEGDATEAAHGGEATSAAADDAPEATADEASAAADASDAAVAEEGTPTAESDAPTAESDAPTAGQDREVEVHTADEGPDEADEPRAQVSPQSNAREERRPSTGPSSADPSAADASRRANSDPARDAHTRVSSAPVSGDLEVARDALVESLERFARRAAETDDPRYAKECLEAAREAGEALSALR